MKVKFLASHGGFIIILFQESRFEKKNEDTNKSESEQKYNKILHRNKKDFKKTSKQYLLCL